MHEITLNDGEHMGGRFFDWEDIMVEFHIDYTTHVRTIDILIQGEKVESLEFDMYNFMWPIRDTMPNAMAEIKDQLAKAMAVILCKYVDIDKWNAYFKVYEWLERSGYADYRWK